MYSRAIARTSLKAIVRPAVGLTGVRSVATPFSLCRSFSTAETQSATSSDYEALRAALNNNDEQKIKEISSRHEPPRKISGFSGQYARDLFVAASIRGLLATVERDLLELQQFLKDNKETAELIQSPAANKKLLPEVFNKLAEGLQLCNLTKFFLGTLQDDKKLRLLDKSITHFLNLCREHNKVVVAEVTLAEIPTIDQLWQFHKYLEKSMLKPDEKLEMQLSIDPICGGGFKMNLKGRQIDNTRRTELESLKKAIDQSMVNKFEKEILDGAPEWLRGSIRIDKSILSPQ